MIRVVVTAYETFPVRESKEAFLVTLATADTLLEALAKLHEQLNAVAMPRQYSSTAGEVFEHLPTVSC
jgi:hypothetical protein